MRIESDRPILEVQPFWVPTQEIPSDLEILRDNLNNFKIRELFRAKGLELPDLEEFNRRVEESLKNESNFIGNGGAGRVYTFSLPEDSENADKICLKIVRHDPDYAKDTHQTLGNTPQLEFDIQTKLTTINTEEVRRTPIALELLHATDNFFVFVMEKMPATNLQFILNGTEEAPKDFDHEEFLFTLEEYIEEMHQHGVVHNDLFARNVMVDRETGLPYIIDFGRSILVDEHMSALEKKKIHERDFTQLNQIIKEVKAKFDIAKKI